jgi:hypothetical protein
MATVLSTQKIVDSTHRTLIKVVGTGGSDANTVLIDVGSLAYSLNVNNKILGVGTDRKSTYRTSIKRIWGQAQTSKVVTLQWQNDTNSPIVTFGSGYFDYNFDSEGLSAAIYTPTGANNTGNIIFSSTATNGDAWTLFIDLKKDNRDYDAGQTADPMAFNNYTFEGALK